MNEITKQYNQLLDEGVSITDLYIYHLIVNDERSYTMSEKEILDTVQEVLNRQYGSSKSIEELVDGLLDGEDPDDEDE